MKVIGYARRSQERHNGYGLEAQEDKIRRWAEYKGDVEVLAVLADDDVSGVMDSSKRPQLSKALQMLKEGQADALVVAKFDRLARSITEFGDVLRWSQEQGWTLVSLDPEVDFGRAHGRAMASMMISFADIEREAFRDRMQAARKAKANKGGYIGGGLAVPYGYRKVERVEADGVKRGAYVPEPVQQERIRIMKTLRLRGETYQYIANHMNERNYQTATGEGQWTPSTVKRILDREERTCR